MRVASGYNNKKMAKLGQQIQTQRGQQTVLGRSERLRSRYQAQRQSVEQQQAIQEAQDKLSQAQTVEEYENIYSKLSPLQKSAFPTPEDLRAKQQGERNLSIGEINTRIEEKRAGITKEQEYIKRQQEKSDPRRRENIQSSEDDIEDYNNEISKLQEGLGRIEAGENIETGAVFEYASDYARYRSDRREGKRRSKDEALKELKPKAEGFDFTGTVQESFKGKSQGTQFFIGGSQVSQKDFMKSYDIYLEPSGKKPIKLVVTRGTDITKFDEQQQQARETSAQTYLQDFSSKVQSPAEQKQGFFARIANTRIGKGLVTLYTASPFGTGIKVDEQTNIARETGSGKFLSLLTYSEASRGFEKERKRKSEAEKQVSLIEELNTLIEGAPEEIKPEVQAYGFKLLGRRGIKTIPSEELGGEPGTILFASEALKPGKSFDAYQIEKEDELEKRALAGEKITGIFISDTVPQKFSVPTRSTTIAEGSFDPFSYETPSAQRLTNVRKGFLYGRIASTKLLEVYGSGKLLEKAGVAVFQGGKYIYEGLGGGLRISELIIKSERTGVAILETAPERSALTKFTIEKGRRTLLAGGLGIYATSRIGSYLNEPRTEAERKEFLLKVTGESFGIGALFGQGAYNKVVNRRINLAIERENLRRIVLAEEKRIASGRAMTGSRSDIKFVEVGQGKTFFQQRQLSELGGQVSKLSGISQEEAITKILEASVGKQTVIVQSALSGKAPTFFNRYSTAISSRTAEGAKTLTFDFNLDKAGKLRNLNVKTTVAGEEYALTNILKKVRARKGKANIEEFQLQETVVSKLSNVRQAEQGSAKITYFNIEDRLVKYQPYGKTRLRGKEVMDIGFQDLDESYMAKLFESATKTRKSGTFMNVRVEGQSYSKLNILERPDVEIVPGLTKRTGDLGNYNTRLNRIQIDKDLMKNPKEFEETLRHELGHASSIRSGALKNYFDQRIAKNPYTGKERAVNPEGSAEAYKKFLKEIYVDLPEAYATNEDAIAELMAEVYGNTKLARTSGIFSSRSVKRISENALFFNNVPVSIGREGEYVFLQKGFGKKFVPTFNLKPEQYAELGNFDKAIERALRRRSSSPTVFDDVIEGSGQMQISQQTFGTQATQGAVKLSDLGVQVPTVAPPSVRTPSTLTFDKAIDNQLGSFGSASRGAVRSSSAQRQPIASKSEQRNRSKLLNAVRQALGQQQQTRQQTGTAQKTTAKQRFLQLTGGTFNVPGTPRITIPKTPTPTTPRITAIALPDFDQEIFERVRKRAKRKKQEKVLSYSEDFTSKIVGFPTQELSQTQINKLVRKTQTGFEIRTPVVLKGSTQSKASKALRRLLAQ